MRWATSQWTVSFFHKAPYFQKRWSFHWSDDYQYAYVVILGREFGFDHGLPF